MEFDNSVLGQPELLIFRRPFYVIDNQKLTGAFSRFEFQTEFLYGVENR